MAPCILLTPSGQMLVLIFLSAMDTVLTPPFDRSRKAVVFGDILFSCVSSCSKAGVQFLTGCRGEEEFHLVRVTSQEGHKVQFR